MNSDGMKNASRLFRLLIYLVVVPVAIDVSDWVLRHHVYPAFEKTSLWCTSCILAALMLVIVKISASIRNESTHTEVVDWKFMLKGACVFAILALAVSGVLSPPASLLPGRAPRSVEITPKLCAYSFLSFCVMFRSFSNSEIIQRYPYNLDVLISVVFTLSRTVVYAFAYNLASGYFTTNGLAYQIGVMSLTNVRFRSTKHAVSILMATNLYDIAMIWFVSRSGMHRKILTGGFSIIRLFSFVSPDRKLLLGLGDLVLPGAFLLLLERMHSSYFRVGCFTYGLSLLLTISCTGEIVPGLPFLVFPTVGAVFVYAALRGEVLRVWTYDSDTVPFVSRSTNSFILYSIHYREAHPERKFTTKELAWRWKREDPGIKAKYSEEASRERRARMG